MSTILATIDRHAGQRRADQPGAVDQRRVERDGVWSGTDHLDDEGLRVVSMALTLRGAPAGPRATAGPGADGDRPRPGGSAEGLVQTDASFIGGRRRRHTGSATSSGPFWSPPDAHRGRRSGDRPATTGPPAASGADQRHRLPAIEKAVRLSARRVRRITIPLPWGLNSLYHTPTEGSKIISGVCNRRSRIGRPVPPAFFTGHDRERDLGRGLARYPARPANGSVSLRVESLLRQPLHQHPHLLPAADRPMYAPGWRAPRASNVVRWPKVTMTTRSAP